MYGFTCALVCMSWVFKFHTCLNIFHSILDGYIYLQINPRYCLSLLRQLTGLGFRSRSDITGYAGDIQLIDKGFQENASSHASCVDCHWCAQRACKGRITASRSSWSTLSKDQSSAELPGVPEWVLLSYRWPTLYVCAIICVYTHFLTVSLSHCLQVTSTEWRYWIGMVSSINHCTLCLKLPLILISPTLGTIY